MTPDVPVSLSLVLTLLSAVSIDLFEIGVHIFQGFVKFIDD